MSETLEHGVPGWRRGFWCLMVTQFQTAFSDNALKNLVILLVLGSALPVEERDTRVALAGALFAAPFILFSMLGGWLADRFSKPLIMGYVKLAEIGIMLFAALALAWGWSALELAAIFLMGCHSALFAPSKYGVLPELLPHDRLSWGNGILELLTFLGIIFGIAAAGLLARRHPAAREVERRLRASPPGHEGWTVLGAADVAHAFAANPPRLDDNRDLHHRIRLACAHAADRSLIAGLAERNPGFLDYLQCFPAARSLRRRVVAWLGPTNSGKTHRALRALAAAPSGMYLGPLRLLALEQRDRLTELGTPCSLITGEERVEASPTHSSRTVEMADFSRKFAVCVLDEMQLAFDRDRGWAWVAAYCGVAAETLVVTGPLSCEPVIRRLGELCGDEVEVHPLERLGTLAYEGVLDWRSVPPRSAVIGFSRPLVLELKAMFESLGQRVAVIYGGLSPEVRREEARRFREGEADLVCATDAIGLGLNLPLDRVVFYETDKFDGRETRRLEAGELLQIGGRAGRGPAAVVAAADDDNIDEDDDDGNEDDDEADKVVHHCECKRACLFVTKSIG